MKKSPTLKTPSERNGILHNLKDPITSETRRRAIQQIFFASLLFASPVNAARPRKKMVPTTMAEPKLTITDAVASDDHVRFTYSVMNNGTSPIYLFNLIDEGYDQQLGYKVNPERCNIELIHSMALISKKIIPVPDTIDVEIRSIPCVTRVAPNGQFSEIISLPLPLKPWTPYDRTVLADGDKRPHSVHAHFEIGYFRSVARTQSLAKLVNTTVGPQLRFPAFSADNQKTVRAPILSKPILMTD
jgi:hypothetical protein